MRFVDFSCCTGFHTATASSFSGFEDAAELLIEKGVDVNLSGQIGNTALIAASAAGTKKTIIPS